MQKVFVLYTLYFFLQLICPFPASAQTPVYRFDHLTTKEGLSSPYIYSIIKDSTGFMWFGTGNGLNRYDGYNMLVYKNIQSDSTSLSDNVVISMLELDADHLLIGTSFGGVNIFDKTREQFLNYKNHQDDSTSLSHNRVSVIYRDSNGLIWLGTQDGLNLFHPDVKTFEVFKQESDSKDDLRNQIRSIFMDSRANLWVGTGSGVFQFDPQKKVFSPVKSHPSFGFDNLVFQVNSVKEDPAGNIWIGSNHGLFKYNNDLKEYIGPPFIHRNWLIEDIEMFTFENKEYAWVSTHWGLFQFDLATNGVKTFNNIPGNEKCISNQAMNELFFDDAGLLWISSFSMGIDILKLRESPFQQHLMLSEPLISYNYSACEFYEDTDGTIWIGSHVAGLFKYDQNLNLISRYRLRFSDNTEFNGGRVKKILRNTSGNLWIGVLNPKPSICIFNEETEIFQLIDTTNMHLAWKFPSNFITDMIEDHKGNMWFGFSSGLAWMEKNENQDFKICAVNHSDLSVSNIRDLYEDGNGRIWIASGKGIYSVEQDKHDSLVFTKYSCSIGVQEVQPLSIYQGDNGQIWAGTNQGLFQLIEDTKQFCLVNENNEWVHSNSINAITEDFKGNLWMATAKGLIKFDPSPDEHIDIKLFENIDGLPYEGSVPAPLFRSRSGKIFVTSKYGSQNGFYCFHPDSIIVNDHIPPVVITDFKVRNESFQLDSAITDKEQIQLGHNENYISFEFAVLDYINARKNQYAYKLDGFDEDWISTGNRRFATYTSVPPGNYTFFVKGSNNDGLWNEKGTSIRITINPPPWKTWWAYCLYFLVLFSLLSLIIRFYIRRQKLIHTLEMEKIQTEKLEELNRLKSSFFANISHEFRTPLTLILGPLDGLLKRIRDDKSKQDLSMIQRSAHRLQRLINQLLNLSKLEAGKMKLQAVEMDIIPLVRGYVQSFESLAKQKGIDLIFNTKDESVSIFVDQDKVEKILFNLLSNAFKFTEPDGRIEVSVHRSSGTQVFRSSGLQVLRSSGSRRPADLPTRQPANPQTRRPFEDGEYLEIQISDTGPGIPPEKLPHIFDRFYQADDSYTKDGEGTGIGLALTKELVELHHGKIEVESEVGKGSVFRFYLPMGREHLAPEQIDESLQLAVDSLQTGEGFGSGEGDEIGNRQLATCPENSVIGNDISEGEHATWNLEPGTIGEKPIILIVEDNADLRLYIRGYLDQTYTIIEAEDGRQGLDLAFEHIPDLIISDVMMPVIDGYELCKELKSDERTSHVPVILLTALASKEKKLEGLETGADDFIIKPFDSDELLIRISNLLDQRKRLSKRLEEKFSKNILPAQFISADSGITSMDEQFLKRAFDTLKSNYSNPEFNVEAFSKEMGLSRNQLHRKIKALTRNTAVEFIRRYRLTLAAELIKMKSATIAEIAYDVGFSSPSYFSECFHKQFGVLPSEYK